MTAEERKRKAELHYNLITVLTNCKNDDEFYQNLIWALSLVALELERFQHEQND